MRLSRRRFLKIGHFWAVFVPPPGPLGCKRPEIYNFMCPLSQRYIILNLKRIRAVYMYKKLKIFKCFVPPWRQNPYPGDHQIYNFGRGLPALYHYAFSFSQTCAVVEKKIFENSSLFGSFCPTPKAPGVQET